MLVAEEVVVTVPMEEELLLLGVLEDTFETLVGELTVVVVLVATIETKSGGEELVIIET